MHLFSKYPETACKLVHLFKEFGYFKDFITILEMIYEKPEFSSLEDQIITVLTDQVSEDKKNIELKKSISLLGKWLPRQDKQFAKKCKKSFLKLLDVLFPGQSRLNGEQFRSYRDLIKLLTLSLNTVETKMCAKKYSEIDYSKVPSVAMKKWSKAYLNQIDLSNTILKQDSIKQRKSSVRRIYEDDEDEVLTVPKVKISAIPATMKHLPREYLELHKDDPDDFKITSDVRYPNDVDRQQGKEHLMATIKSKDPK